MCGIAGFISERLTDKHLYAVLDTMHLRGPDGIGECHEKSLHMGMCRLSIIDLNHGWQPIFGRNGSVVVFQNGEIYNYQELRNQLEKLNYLFVTSSDTEVLAHGYVQWGWEGLLERVDGMYAISILDKDINRLFLARDRFGEKPLFYTHTSGEFAYASTMLALSVMPWVSDNFDVKSLDNYLALHFITGSRTVFSDIHQVLPGEYIEVDLKDKSFFNRRYYNTKPSSEKKSDHDLIVALDHAVSSRLVADVPVGVFLSGGLDSSLVAAIAAKSNPGVKTFSMGFSDEKSDESKYAKDLASYIGSEHYCFNFDDSVFFDLIPQVANALDVPLGDQALLPVFWLSKEASKHVKVVLSGEGADEIFAGYSYYKKFLSLSPVSIWEKLLYAIRSSNKNTSLLDEDKAILISGYPITMGRDDRELVLRNSQEKLSDSLGENEWSLELVNQLNGYQNKLLQATLCDFNTWLPYDLLVKLDQMTMAHSLEGRAPFLSPELVKLGFSLNEPDRMKGSVSKVALRRIASKYLPRDLLQRPKQGFVLPMSKWIIKWFKLHGGVVEYFSRKSFPGFDMDYLMKIVEHDLSYGVYRERLLFSLIMFVEWWDAFDKKKKLLEKEFNNIAANKEKGAVNAICT